MEKVLVVRHKQKEKRTIDQESEMNRDVYIYAIA